MSSRSGQFPSLRDFTNSALLDCISRPNFEVLKGARLYLNSLFNLRNSTVAPLFERAAAALRVHRWNKSGHITTQTFWEAKWRNPRKPWAGHQREISFEQTHLIAYFTL